MRKLCTLLLAALMLFSAAACDSESAESGYSEIIEEGSEPDVGTSDTTKRTTRRKTTTRRKKTTTRVKKTTTTAKPSAHSSTTTGVSNTPPVNVTTAKTTTKTTTKKPTTTTRKPIDISGINPEKPVTVNTAVLYDWKTSPYDATAESRRQSILNAADTVKASGGKTYYISPNGNDNNNGLTKSTAWKNPRTITNGRAKSGDVVLFERGGVWRDVYINLPTGVSLGAYGSGPKPCLYGSDKNYAVASLWTKYGDNIWRTTVPEATNTAFIEDIGNIVFDYGKQYSSPGKKMSLSLLKKDYDFYYDKATNNVYLYLSKGNPANVHKSIEMCNNEHIIRGNGGNNTIENLCLKYTGAHGISFSAASNVTVRGCEVGHIGGALLEAGVRYGNGIEFYVAANTTAANNNIKNNWVYQCYDAGYTHQGDGWFKNYTVSGNLIEYCLYNIEIWTVKTVGSGGQVNCLLYNNYLRFAGYGYSRAVGRLGSNTSVVGNISTYANIIPSQNCNITNNLFDCSYRYVINIAFPNDSQGRGPNISGNTWVQRTYSNGDTTAVVGATRNSIGRLIKHACTTQAEMETSVKLFDKNPKAIVLLPAE